MWIVSRERFRCGLYLSVTLVFFPTCVSVELPTVDLIQFNSIYITIIQSYQSLKIGHLYLVLRFSSPIIAAIMVALLIELAHPTESEEDEEMQNSLVIQSFLGFSSDFKSWVVEFDQPFCDFQTIRGFGFGCLSLYRRISWILSVSGSRRFAAELRFVSLTHLQQLADVASKNHHGSISRPIMISTYVPNFSIYLISSSYLIWSEYIRDIVQATQIMSTDIFASISCDAWNCNDFSIFNHKNVNVAFPYAEMVARLRQFAVILILGVSQYITTLFAEKKIRIASSSSLPSLVWEVVDHICDGNFRSPSSHSWCFCCMNLTRYNL